MSELSSKLKELREAKGLNQLDLAEIAGISKSYYNDIETRGKTPSNKVIHLLAKALEVNPDYLKGKGDKVVSNELKDLRLASATVDIVLIPLVGEVRAGLSMYAQNNIEGYIRVDGSEVSPDKTYFFLNVVGDSMDKVIRDGDKVLVEHTSAVETGDIVIALTEDNEATIKKIRFNRDSIALIPESTNPLHEIQNFQPSQLSIIGKVIKAERYF